MIKNLSNGDILKEKELVFEALTSIKRAGADLIITYFGKEVLGWLTKQ
jgi:porphobilinogen synthase